MCDAVVQTILSRRSVRTGYYGSVDAGTLDMVLKCGLAAPSSKNAKPWRLHVVQNRSTLMGIAAAVLASDGLKDYVPRDPSTGAPHPYWQSSVIESASVLSEAPAAVFIENRGVFTGGRDGLVDAPRDRLKGSLTGYGLELVGIGAALQNMWIAALSLGLSAAFLGDIGIAERRIKDDLAIQGDVVGALVLGYSRDLPTPALPPPPETQTTMPVVRHD